MALVGAAHLGFFLLLSGLRGRSRLCSSWGRSAEARSLGCTVLDGHLLDEGLLLAHTPLVRLLCNGINHYSLHFSRLTFPLCLSRVVTSVTTAYDCPDYAELLCIRDGPGSNDWKKVSDLYWVRSLLT